MPVTTVGSEKSWRLPKKGDQKFAVNKNGERLDEIVPFRPNKATKSSRRPLLASAVNENGERLDEIVPFRQNVGRHCRFLVGVARIYTPVFTGLEYWWNDAFNQG